ncbi:MAG: di-heme oxidoredictase family protein, partial [Geminicoccaceae bacterium]
ISLIGLAGCVTDGPNGPEFFGSSEQALDLPSGPIMKLVGDVHEPMATHTTQGEFLRVVAEEPRETAFHEIFDLGDELFDTDFNSLDGGGANVGNGMRFSRVPRADLKGEKQWASHIPFRHTGPNAQSCTACHNQPFEDGAGGAAMNVVRDPTGSGRVDQFIVRNATHLFGIGGLQRLAEEMTDDLQAVRVKAALEAKLKDEAVTKPLEAKGVDFGMITAKADGTFDLSEVSGLDDDLIIKPLQWKGTDVTIRKFTRDASHRELGVQPVELVGEGVDGDFDGVTDELTVGDVTAMTVYLAGQPRPTTKLELVELGLIDPLEPGEEEAIGAGEEVFGSVGCAVCHKPELTLNDPVFSEPSQNENYRDEVFPGGQNPKDVGVYPEMAIKFDLTKDLPDNELELADGSTVNFGNFEPDNDGGAVIRLFGDLKRHDLGAELAESVDEEGKGASTFMTAELWGVGDTGPYLHDGRAPTLTDAILAHGGDAAASRDAYEELSTEEQSSLIAFLNNLVLFKIEEEEEEEHESEVATLVQ